MNMNTNAKLIIFLIKHIKCNINSKWKMNRFADKDALQGSLIDTLREAQPTQ